jgi:hypothetical protein
MKTFRDFKIDETVRATSERLIKKLTNILVNRKSIVIDYGYMSEKIYFEYFSFFTIKVDYFNIKTVTEFNNVVKITLRNNEVVTLYLTALN